LFKPSNISLKNVELISKKRNKWMDFLLRKGISTRPSTHAVHMLNFYKEKYKHKPEDFLQSYIANHCSVSLPLYHGITEKEQDYVIKTVIKSL
jgi:dTDP-4-amino-4,6-dideoxygalactose transaminase